MTMHNSTSAYFFQWHRDHGIDTLLISQNSAQPCGSSTLGSVIAGQLAPKYNFYILAQPDIPLKDVKNTSNILAMFLSDESDSHVSFIACTFIHSWRSVL